MAAPAPVTTVSGQHRGSQHAPARMAARWGMRAAVLTALAWSLPSFGQSVALAGLMGPRALLVIDGQAPKSLAPGESHLGVKLLSAGEGQAVVEIKDRRHNLRLGESPVSIGSSRDEGRGTRIVLKAGSGGHFFAEGQINGKSARLMVDTGASLVALSAAEAEQLGLDYKNGQRASVSTANGVAMGWILKLDSVRIGDVTVHAVDAIVTPQPMPFILLGNSFLGRFQMNRENDQLTLSRRF